MVRGEKAEKRVISRSQAALRHLSGIPLYIRSRSLDSFEARIRQPSTLLPCPAILGTSIRVHLSMRDDSLGDTVAGGKELIIIALGGAEGGPGEATVNFLSKGAE